VARFKVGILASGSGTLLEAILEAADVYEVTSVISDRPARALEIAEAAGIPGVLLAYKDFGDRDAFSAAVATSQADHGLDLSASAGFGRVLSQPYFDGIGDVPYINSHPALLPAFPGWHAVREALEYGVKTTGTSIILCDLGTDSGPILAQEPVAVLEGDTEESLHERIKAVERRLFPEVIRLYAAGRVKVEGRRVHILPSSG
jgi:phosphoribosylglycinamide formyltransferase-1